MLTIGKLAAYAGVTIKAVRHYHKVGLLAEPDRDASGYRRYGAEHAIRLVKIKTLAEAGVPLARVRSLLEADRATLDRALTEIDRDLRERAAELERTRQRIARLRDSDDLFVSAEAAAFLDRIAELGVSRRGVEQERDVWILLRSAAPAEAAIWLADKIDALEDPEFRALYVQTDDAYEWAPDDPRLPSLACRTRAWLAARPPRAVRPDPELARLVASQIGATAPAWDELGRLMTQPQLAPRRTAGGRR